MGLEAVASKAWTAWSIQLVQRGNELHGPCPFCAGGKDRFIVWPEGNYWCRVCETSGRVPGTGDRKLSRDTLVQVVAAKRAKQAQRLSEWQESSYRAGFIAGYHEAMADNQRGYWLGEGITDESIERYQLGYCAERTFEGEGGQTFNSPAFTIPHYDPDSLQLVNCQYRIIELPPGAGGKYRQEPGLPAASFFTKPKVLSGAAIVFEGAKKAIVLSQLIDRKLQTVGWPGIMPPEELYLQLEDFSDIWLCLDPGPTRDDIRRRTRAEERAKDYLGDRIRVVNIPVKPDDAVTRWGMSAGDFRQYLALAR